MSKITLNEEKINSDATSNWKGFNMQLARVVWRALQYLLKDEKKKVYFVLDYKDDVLVVDESEETNIFITEQDKVSKRKFSIKSREILNSLRIFFDNWCDSYGMSSSINFVFYTNASIAKEYKIKDCTDIVNRDELLDTPLLQALIDKDHDRIRKYVIPKFKEYYIKQYSRNGKNISVFEKKIHSITDEKWEDFFNLIDWNFEGKTSEEIFKENRTIIRQICTEKGRKYSDSILDQICGKFSIRSDKEDYLTRIVHISEIENVFLELESIGRPELVFEAASISDNDHGKRFSYDSNLTHLRGRDKEMQYLHDFCEAKEYLIWTAICGQGGVGKTRLAFELCKIMDEKGWKVVLPEPAEGWLKEKDVNIKESSKNILICLDYVKYSIEEIKDFMEQLYKSGKYSERKIRFILIDRNEDDFDDLIQKYSAVEDYLYIADDKNVTNDGLIRLELLEDDAILSIVHDYINEYKKQKPSVVKKALSTDEENLILDVLFKIDPDKKRPLYALFIADAWCAGEPMEKWNKSDALHYIMKKELRQITNAVKAMDFLQQEKSIYEKAVHYAVAMGTYAENIKTEDIYNFIEKSFDGIDIEKIVQILKNTNYLTEDGEKIKAIKPDLIGEYWCLETLYKCDEKNVNLFFEVIFNSSFWNALRFSDKLYADYICDHCIQQDISWWKNIERMVYPVNLTYVRKNAFRGYRFIKTVILHNNITKIEAGAFRDCENMETIVFPPSLETIGSFAFANCTHLVSALPSDKKGKEPSILSIEDNAFKGCISLREIIIPESVVSIGYSAFEKCEQVEEIVIPRKIEKIESYTFADCTKLKKVVFSYNKKIDLSERAFWRCCQLCIIDGANRISYIGEKAFGKCKSLIKISSLSRLSKIEKGAFANCTELTEVDLSDSEISILPDKIFENCDHLESIRLPETLKTIGQCSFYNCKRLSDIKFPAQVKIIESYAFYNCDTLKALELPHSDITVMHHAISGCKNITLSNLKNIPNNGKQFCGFVFSSITEKEIDFLTSYDTEENIEIPDSVIEIGARAFFYQEHLKQIQIPKSVTAIGDEAFRKCNSLVEVDAKDNSITKIGKGAFEGCTSLELLIGELRLSQIEDNVFKNCNVLKEIIIPGSLMEIGEYAFANCTNLKNIFKNKCIPPRSIGLNAFMNCEKIFFPINLNYFYKKKIVPHKLNLYGFVFRKIGKGELKFLTNFWNQENVVIPPTCIRFEGSLFSGHQTMKTIKVPKSIRKLPKGAFANCKNLESIWLPKDLKKLPSGVFLNCESLKQIIFEGFSENTIPDNVIIEKEAFSGCSSLKKLSLPSELKIIRKNTFYGCRLLQEINLPQGITCIEKSAFQLCKELKSVTIPSSLERIDNCAFMECTSLCKVEKLELSQVTDLNNDVFKKCINLETIKLPKNLDRIGAGAFFSCHSLKNIELPAKLYEIGIAAFQECYKLHDIEIPYNVTEIQGFTFKYCSSLEKVEHFDRIKHIGTSAFYNCNSLQEFKMPQKIERIGDSAFAFCHSLDNVKIPHTVENLPNGLFEGCVLLKNVEIPDHIKSIPVNCFKDCNNLTDFKFPTAIETIGAGAFRNCHSYNPSHFPDTLKQIGPSAFRSCDKLSEISLPALINSIEVSAFGYCDNLRKVEFAAVNEVGNYAFIGCSKLSEIPFQNIKKRIGIAAFLDCAALKEVNFSETITTIDSSAFRGCSGLTCITLPPLIKNINGAVFRENLSLEEVNLPESIEIIKKSAFRDCLNLSTVNIKSKKIEIWANAFNGCRELRGGIEIPPNSFVNSSAFIDCPAGKYILSRDDIIISDTVSVDSLLDTEIQNP